MKPYNIQSFRSDLGEVSAARVIAKPTGEIRSVSVSGTEVTITPETNTLYQCGELTALTVTAVAAAGDFIIRFTSGSTATTTDFPVDMVFPEAFAAKANKRYEINVSDGDALVASWPVTAS